VFRVCALPYTDEKFSGIVADPATYLQRTPQVSMAALIKTSGSTGSVAAPKATDSASLFLPAWFLGSVTQASASCIRDGVRPVLVWPPLDDRQEQRTPCRS